MTLRVSLVSPEEVLFEGDADMVIARVLEEGDVAFLTGHAPFLGALATHPVELILRCQFVQRSTGRHCRRHIGAGPQAGEGVVQRHPATPQRGGKISVGQSGFQRCLDEAVTRGLRPGERARVSAQIRNVSGDFGPDGH